MTFSIKKVNNSTALGQESIKAMLANGWALVATSLNTTVLEKKDTPRSY